MEREISIQEGVITKLTEELGLYPFNVTFSESAGNPYGLLGITFFLRTDLDALLEYLGYSWMADRSGILVLSENNTVILSGIALVNLYTKI